jgi:thioredoxin reductase
MSAQPSAVAQHPPAAHDALRVVVVGGGIAAAEALLALRDLAASECR